MRLRKLYSFILFLILFFSLTTCGLEEYYYIFPVEDVNYYEDTTITHVSLPSIPSAYYYVDKFTVFYRIYLSNSYVISVNSPAERMDISQQLENDFNHFNNTLINPTNAPAPTRNSFTSRNYYEIILNSNVLNASAGSGSREIQFVFNIGDNGKITYAGNEYPIYRNDSLQLIPNDGLFYYSDDLLHYDDSTGPGKTYNADVFGAPDTGYSSIYVSMYIVIEGSANLQPLYSKPKHIGIFRIQ